MYQDDRWTGVTVDELEGFISQVTPIDGKYHATAATTEISWRTLPFYENVVLIRLKDRTWGKNNLVLYYLSNLGELHRLNGTSPPIHEVNSKAPIKVTEENVLDYLRFFCFFVRGEEGPFLIAETMEDPYIPKTTDAKALAVIEGTVRPASYEGKNEQGYFLCDAVVYYSNAMFIANFAVQPSGMIEMLSDEPIAADLPVKVDAPVN